MQGNPIVASFVVCQALVVPSPHPRWSTSLSATDEPRAYYCLQDDSGFGTCTIEFVDEDVEAPRRFLVAGKHDIRVQELSFYQGKLGAKVWPCGIATATWCAANAHLFAGKRVLELGSGVGLSGLACAAVNATVDLTDLDAHDETDGPSDLVANLRRNIALNDFRAVSARELDWSDERNVAVQYDVLLASDCIYYPENVLPLARTIKRHLAVGRGVAYVSSPIRDWSTARYPRATAQDLVAALEARDDGRCEVLARQFLSLSTIAGMQKILLLEARLRW